MGKEYNKCGQFKEHIAFSTMVTIPTIIITMINMIHKVM
jgi:hypothetical protein